MNILGIGETGDTGEPDRPLECEIVRLYLYDVGTKIDLSRVPSLIPAHADIGIVKRRDTPASITLPKPLVVSLGSDAQAAATGGTPGVVVTRAKIYDDGAITLYVRFRARVPFRRLGTLRDTAVTIAGRSLPVSEFAQSLFQNLRTAIGPAITAAPGNGPDLAETYTAYCLLECPDDDPAAFIARHREEAAALLAGETPGILHESQILQTLAKPVSYGKHDIAIFDLDRCLVVDPSADYEDLLLIAEHANYRLLELRALDSLLDAWLGEAERDLRRLNADAKKHADSRRRIRSKFARIQALRFDALFIFENLDNSSKIIGDFFLGEVYAQLCHIFNTEAWKLSVERRLEALQDVYDIVRADTVERRMMTLEVVFIAVCIILPLLQIIQVMLSG